MDIDEIKAQVRSQLLDLLRESNKRERKGEIDPETAFLSGVLLCANVLAKHDGHRYLTPQLIVGVTAELSEELGHDLVN